MGNFKFSKSLNKRNKLIYDQTKKIKDSYKEISKNIGEDAKQLNNNLVVTKGLRKGMLDKVVDETKKELSENSDNFINNLKDSMKEVSDSVSDENKQKLKTYGVQPKSKYTDISDNVVEDITSGKLYGSNWSLSQAVWGSDKEVLDNIAKIVKDGIDNDKTAYEIAKEVEGYTNPDYKGGDVSFRARRLAVTEINHAYHRSIIESTKDSPFVIGYEWHANGSNPCPICQDRDGQIYSADNVPIDHPNGMCDIEVVMMDDDDILAWLEEWENSPDGTFPEIDAYAESILEL
jgi:SPP1 gp7 family putative phage head morphogenesis protein